MHKSPVEAFAPVFRLRGDTSPLFSSLSVRVATATTAGGGLSPSVLSFVSSLELRCAGSLDCGGVLEYVCVGPYRRPGPSMRPM